MKEYKRDMGGLVFVGCMFVGIGLGLVYGQVAGATLIGMGVGFLGMVLFGKRR